MRKLEQWQDMIARLYPELHEKSSEGDRTLSRTITFQVTDACNLACSYCLSGDMMIRMADYTEKPIKDVRVGDIVVGFDENAEYKKQRKLRKSVVEQIFSRKANIIEILFDNNQILKVTPNHKILFERGWREAGQLKVGDKVFTLPTKDSNLDLFNRASLRKSTIIDIRRSDEDITVYNIGTSTHTYIANSIAVHNCYQINKGTRRMSFDTAKKFIDMLLTGDKELGGYSDPKTSPGIILEFIGGEPFLEVELIDKICDYFYNTAIELGHPWAEKFCFSICSNGVLGMSPQVQSFINKWKRHLSYSITIDGNKELHDSCRVFEDGSGSYDLAVEAAKDWINKGGEMGSKITIAPANLPYIKDAIIHMVELGYNEINANTVYEKGWTVEHAREYYKQLKEIANYWIDNDLVETHYLALFEDNYFTPMDEMDNDNWCWGIGTPVLTIDGYKPIEDIKIGDIVYTEDGTTHPVINTTSHFADNVVNISVSGAFDLTCTDNHKLFVKPADRDKLYGKYQIKDIKYNDSIKLFQFKTEGNVAFDKNLAYVVGRYIGDGWHSTTGHKICCAYDEEVELKEKLDKAKIKYSIDDYPTVKQFNLFKSNKELINILFYCGENASSKHLPPECFNWCKDSLKSLINGYMDADGTYNKDEQYRFNTVSYRLAQELMVILRTLNYTPICYHCERGGESVILGRKVHTKDRYEVYYYKDPKRSKYVHENDNGTWTYGLKVNEAEPQIVYNITVDTNHSYVAGGVVSANCGGVNSFMLSIDPDGYLYPCIRYMESSLGTEIEPIRIGHVDTGIAQCESCRKCLDMVSNITRRSQSTDECFYCPIAQGCAWCFKAGTLITTPEGFKPIEEIQIGDEVVSGTGNIKKVKKINKRYTNDTVEIKAAGILPIYTTDEHPFLVRNFYRNGNSSLYDKPQWKPANEIKKSDRIGLFVGRFGKKHIDKHVAYIVGRYLGDGWKTKRRKNDSSFSYYLCCSYEESVELEEKLALAKISYCKDEIPHTAQQYTLHSTNHEISNNNELLISIISNCGNYAYDKHVPSCIYDWDKESISSFVKGYFDADGKYDKERDIVKFTTASKLLAQGLFSIMLLFGKKINWCVRENGSNLIEGTHTIYELSFLNHELERKDYEFDKDNRIMWVNVRSINSNISGYEVYNMSVADDHTFVANGAIVHNCSAYNYQESGSVNNRVTYICDMHKARALANVYFWNTYYRKNDIQDTQTGKQKRFINYCPDEWALEIIDEKELDELKKLASE